MYPNLYYVFKDWFGVEWHALGFLNTFGLMVALGFLAAAWILSLELKRKEKMGLMAPREEMIVIGKPASMSELLTNGLLGFIFGYKFLGLFLSKPDSVSAQDFIFSGNGSLIGGILLGGLMVFLKWNDKNKQKLKNPENRNIRIWPHDRVGDIIVLGLIFGILGAKLFDNLEHWEDFSQHPIQSLLSPSGLTFYGGLILAAIAICWFAVRKGIKIKHLVDAAAPALMIAYAIGRLGCQIAGDGDWGIYNSAYVSDNTGKISIANNDDFKKALTNYGGYFTQGSVIENGRAVYVTDRTYANLDAVPHLNFKGPSFLPSWLFAYSYPQNVNKDGIPIPGITDEHNKVLPCPVFPTPIYETIICSLIFMLLWLTRKKIKKPLFMFGLYLTLNGTERFFIETMRVNSTYAIMGMKLTQAEIIAICLFVAGIVLMLFPKKTTALKESENL